MEAEEFMNLFDSQWFGSMPEEIPTTAMLMFQKIEHFQIRSSRSEKSIIVQPKLLQKILLEKESIVDAEKSIIVQPKLLQKILLEKESIADAKPRYRKQRGGKQGKGLRRSLSALEFEEICGPYLSEAWGVLDERESGGRMNWKTPYTKNEIKMKNHLRFWAHAVASNVK